MEPNREEQNSAEYDRPTEINDLISGNTMKLSSETTINDVFEWSCALRFGVVILTSAPTSRMTRSSAVRGS